MKKEYKKPVVAVESFQLDASIAGACKDKKAHVINHYQSTCTVDKDEEGYIGQSFFGSANGSCEKLDDTFYCYQGPTNDISAMYLES